MRTYSVWVKRVKGEVWSKVAEGLTAGDAAALCEIYRMNGRHEFIEAEEDGI